MINFSMAYIFLAFVIIIGVIFIVNGLYKKPNEESFEIMKLREIPQVPNTWDIPFIENQLQKIQNRPQMIANYFTALRVTFSLERQMEILDRMERYNLKVANGIKSHTEILIAQREKQVAENDLATINDDIEIKRLEREARKSELNHKIQELKKTSKDEKSQLSQYEERLRLKNLKERIERQVKMEQMAGNIRDRFAFRRMVKGIGEEEEKKTYEEVLKGKNLSEATKEDQEEIAQRLGDLDDLIRQILDKE